MKKNLVITLIALLFSWQLVLSQTTQTFEGSTVGNSTFISGTFTGNLSPTSTHKIGTIPGYGYLSSDKFIESTSANGTISSTTTFKVASLYLYPSTDGGNNNQTVGVSVTLTGKLGGVNQFVYTPPSSNFSGATYTNATNRGFSLINLATPGHENKVIDELVISLGNSANYFAIDNFTYTPVIATPTITTSGTLSAFSACAGTASTQQSFTVSGANLTANLVVTAPTGFEVSTSSGSGYGSSVSLPPSSGTVSSTSIFVRLTSSASGSPSGNVTCTSTSATTQNVAASGTVTSSVTPSVSIAITSGSQSTCAGSSVTFTATPTNGGGSPTYDFRVNGSSVQNSSSATYTSTSLTNGQTVTCVMTANNTCQTSATANSNSIGMSVSGLISLTAASQTNVSCFGGSNGAATVNSASGGTPGYTYDWTPGTPTGDGTTSVSGLSAGTWTCTVTDANGCTAARNFILTAPTSISVTAASLTTVSCFGGSNGAASINTPTGGTGTYTYDWTPGTPFGDGSTSVAGLGVGMWTCTVTDENGCTGSQNFNVTQPTVLALSINSQTDISCFGASNGLASVNGATGGVSDYTYDWTPGTPAGDGTISASDLAPGSWTCTVTDANGCTASQNFTLTEPAELTADAPSNVSVCDSYTLPALTVGNYFTGTNGTGTALSAGNAITSSQTIYVYETNGTCSDENSFEVTINATPTITSTLSAARCDAGILTLEATPSAGTINWFAAASGGSSLFTGTSFTTPSISATTTYYAQVANGSCTNNTRTAVVATIGGCTRIQGTQCGTTLANNTSAIIANTVIGATNYRFEISGPNGYLQILNNTSRWFYLSSLPTYELGQTYSVRVQASLNGGTTYSDYGQACNITTFYPTTQLQTSQCGATLTSNASAILANTVAGATNYRFEVSGPNGFFQLVNKSTRLLYLTDLSSYERGQTYSIRVQVSLSNGASYGPFGSACNITTDFPSTQLPTSQCGITLTSNNSAIVATSVADATNYRFEVTGPNGYYQLISKTIRQLYLSDLATYERGQTYSIRVCLSFNNGSTYGPFGSACNITTSHPRTQIQTSQCGATLTSNTTAIVANPITGVANYRFEVSGPNGYLQVVTKTVRQLFLSDLPSYELGQTYSIRVQLRLTNAAIYGPYGTACNITTASTMPLAPNSNIELKSMNEPTFDFEAFPNPSNGDFTISSSEAGTFNIINELGQLVRTVEITEANGNQERVENMPNGAYFVTGTLNGEVVTKKVMVVR